MPISIEADPSLAQGYIKVNGTTAATVTASGIVSGGVPAGAVMAFAMNSAPSGWLACNGAAVNRTGTYAALFAAIGTTYGAGDGSTTFALPDLRGYFVRGWGVAGQNGANSDGTVSGTFGAKQEDAFKSHTHNIDNFASSGNFGTTGTQFGPVRYGSTATDAALATGGTETRPKNIAMLYCIKH